LPTARSLYDKFMTHDLIGALGMTDPATTDYESIDYFTDETLIADPFPYFEYLRAKCPVAREPHHGVMAITGYDEALEVFNDSVTFSNCNTVTGPFPGWPVPFEGDDVSAIIEQYRGLQPLGNYLPTLDPPEHTDHRALLMRLLTPRRLKENEDIMWRLADRLLDNLLDGMSGPSECDFVGQFAEPYTFFVIADLLGVPEEDRTGLLAQRTAGRRPASIEGEEATLPANPLSYLEQAFTAYVEDRRREPREDVLTKLANATYPDGSIPPVIDIVRTASFLFVAGQETTVRLIAAAVQILGERPDLQQMVRDDRSRLASFIEETLRIESPVKSHFRMARHTTTVGGVEVPAGTTVMLLDGAVNRDPRRFENPSEFDIDRPNVRHHLSFGQGVHTCPGAPLARAETRIALERVLDRMGDITISEAHHGPADARRYEYSPTYLFRGLQNLHIEFTPQGAQGA
jgi:cytochrome P450